MAVKIGSARIDENGHITGGKAGDQTGREVSTQDWYLHSKGWRVFRPILTDQAEKIALAMERACRNDNIGYDQCGRNSLYNLVKGDGFDPAKAASKTETDCSALVRVCCAFAGIMLADFNTGTEAARLLASGAFREITESKVRNGSEYLRRGDVLVTKTKGHTAVVLSYGSKVNEIPLTKAYELGDRILRNGSEGDDVHELQSLLIQLGCDCGRWGADGDFGDATEMAVRGYQRAHNLLEDGEAGPDTIGSILAEMQASAQTGDAVRIIGGSCYVRSSPDTNGARLGTAQEGSTHPYAGETSNDGWLKIRYRDRAGWVSGRYGRIEE